MLCGEYARCDMVYIYFVPFTPSTRSGLGPLDHFAAIFKVDMLSGYATLSFQARGGTPSGLEQF